MFVKQTNIQDFPKKLIIYIYTKIGGKEEKKVSQLKLACNVQPNVDLTQK
jgi:hypothetical protein